MTLCHKLRRHWGGAARAHSLHVVAPTAQCAVVVMCGVCVYLLRTQPGGTQESMRPAAIASLLGYTIGLPAAFFAILVVHRTAIFQDQTLRQRNLGNDPASNPHFSTRKRYKELCVQLTAMHIVGGV